MSIVGGAGSNNMNSYGGPGGAGGNMTNNYNHHPVGVGGHPQNLPHGQQPHHHGGAHPIAAMNSMMGRSPKRLHTSEEDLGGGMHPQQAGHHPPAYPPQYGAVAGSVDSEHASQQHPQSQLQQSHHHPAAGGHHPGGPPPGMHPQQHHNLHPGQHPGQFASHPQHPHHAAQQQHLHANNPHHPHHPSAVTHPHMTNHPMGNSLHHHHHHNQGGPGVGPPNNGLGNSNNQFATAANFHSQTRVGGANPPLSVVSSSVCMVTESNNSSSAVFSNSSGITTMAGTTTGVSTTSSSTQGLGTSSLIVSPVSSAGSISFPGNNKGFSSEESPVFRLASAVDSIGKSESSHLGSNDSKKFSQLVGLLNDENSSSNSNTPPVSASSNSAINFGDIPEVSIKIESSKNWSDVRKTEVVSRSASIDDIVKKEDQCALNMECETIPNFPVNPTKERTSSSSVGLKGGSSNFRRTKSIEQDPFEFNEGFLDPGASRDSFGTDQSEVSDEFESKYSFGGSFNKSSNTSTAHTSLSKLTSTATTAKVEKLDSFEFKAEDYNHKRDRKKISKQDAVLNREYTVEESKKPMLGITMKINAKDGSAKAYVKQSPIHRSDSPMEFELLSTNSAASKKWKESSSRIVGSFKQGSITPDRSSDMSVDSDVFVVVPDSGNMGGGSLSTSPRGGKSNKSSEHHSHHHSHHHHHHHHKSSSGALVVKEKKKKSSKSGMSRVHSRISLGGYSFPIKCTTQ